VKIRATSAADAGFAGVGRYGNGSKEEPIEVVMAPRSGPDFNREWARLDSNQGPDGYEPPALTS
jgi:hypothetical protein